MNLSGAQIVRWNRTVPRPERRAIHLTGRRRRSGVLNWLDRLMVKFHLSESKRVLKMSWRRSPLNSGPDLIGFKDHHENPHKLVVKF